MPCHGYPPSMTIAFLEIAHVIAKHNGTLVTENVKLQLATTPWPLLLVPCLYILSLCLEVGSCPLVNTTLGLFWAMLSWLTVVAYFLTNRQDN